MISHANTLSTKDTIAVSEVEILLERWLPVWSEFRVSDSSDRFLRGPRATPSRGDPRCRATGPTWMGCGLQPPEAENRARPADDLQKILQIKFCLLLFKKLFIRQNQQFWILKTGIKRPRFSTQKQSSMFWPAQVRPCPSGRRRTREWDEGRFWNEP